MSHETNEYGKHGLKAKAQSVPRVSGDRRRHDYELFPQTVDLRLVRMLLNAITLDASGCWLWAGAIASTEYGYLSFQGRTIYAHRLVYELARGPIPPFLTIDHLCHNRACCNPAHLEAVTRGENVLRGNSPGAIAARTQTCARGHAYTIENTYIAPRTGRRMCRQCVKLRQAKHAAKKKGLQFEYEPVSSGWRSNPAPPCDGDKVKARRRIRYEVSSGRRPHADTLACTDCGHLGSDRRHEYDHYLGYAAEHHRDVQPVCAKCHSRREHERGAARHARTRDGRFTTLPPNTTPAPTQKEPA